MDLGLLNRRLTLAALDGMLGNPQQPDEDVILRLNDDLANMSVIIPDSDLSAPALAIEARLKRARSRQAN